MAAVAGAGRGAQIGGVLRERCQDNTYMRLTINTEHIERIIMIMAGRPGDDDADDDNGEDENADECHINR